MTMAIGTILLLGLPFIACKKTSTTSSIQQIFTQQQRVDASSETTGFLAAIESGCAAFVIDETAGIAMSADHCHVKVNDRVCFDAKHASDAAETWVTQCAYRGKVQEIIELGNGSLDYVIFRFSLLEKPRPFNPMLLSKSPDLLKTLLQSKDVISMTGYPGDEYAQGFKTTSWCRVRSDRSVVNYAEYKLMLTKLRSTWRDDQKYNRHRDFGKMVQECSHMMDLHADYVSSDHQTVFHHDCSVYGGNSGGPIYTLVRGVRVAIGMPQTYSSDPNVDAGCLEYWDTFFRPILNTDPWVDRNWNAYDRESATIEELPYAVPMHLIVKQSKFLKAHPKYLH